MVRDFYYLKADSDTCLRYDRENRAFVPAVKPASIVTVEKLASDAETYRPIYSNSSRWRCQCIRPYIASMSLQEKKRNRG